MIKCEICGKEFVQITGTHLKKHDTNMEEYKNKFPNSITISEEARKNLSQKCKEQHKNENFGFRDGHKVNLNKEPWNKGLTKETNEKVAQYAESLKGRKISDEQKIKLSKIMKQRHKDNPDMIRGKNNGMYGKKLSPEHLKALWSTTYQNINKVEQKAQKTLLPYGFKYVGDRKFWLTFKDGSHKCPDFINKKAKIAVEIYGDYWHKDDDPNDIIEKYKEIGWDCYVYWEHEVNNYELSPDRFEQDLGIFEEEEFTFYDFDGKWMA